MELPRLVETRPTGHGRARGLVSSRVSGRRVDARTFAPSETLDGLVATHWCGRWDLEGQPPHETELLADPSMNLVVEQGDGETSGRVVGIWTELWRRTLSGRGVVRGVKLLPGAVGAFVDASAHTFQNRMVPLSELFDDHGELVSALVETEEDATACARFDLWLQRKLRPDLDEVRLAVAVAARVASDRTITTVERLADVAGISVRGLQRLFRRHVGASPKWVIRLHRLQEVALRLERGDQQSLADLAADLGYTDQAHLNRDFKSAIGKSPTQFFAALDAEILPLPDSERLEFRLWRPEDLDLATQLWGDPEVTRLIDARTPLSGVQVKNKLKEEIERQHAHGYSYWPIFSKEDGGHVGCAGLRPHQAGSLEIGFHIRRDRWRCGFGREAAEAVIRHAFELLHVEALFAGHNPNNRASAKLLRSLGFVYQRDEYYPPTGLKHPSYLLRRR